VGLHYDTLRVVSTSGNMATYTTSLNKVYISSEKALKRYASLSALEPLREQQDEQEY